jgi:hypothetical protein
LPDGKCHEQEIERVVEKCAVNRLKGAEEPAPVTTKECPFCLSAVAIKATRCPHSTSELRTG